LAQQSITNALRALLTIACLLLAAQRTEAAQDSKSNMTSKARWQAHPQKGWVPAAQLEERRDKKTENSKTLKKRLRNRGRDKTDHK
jgi:hypothetical protein